MIRAAITGNIGSGKSTVVKIFKSLNVPVFIADVEAKQLYKEEDVKAEIRKLFGNHLFNSNNQLEKKVLASIIFNDKKALRQINDLIHPLTLNRYNKWLEENKNSTYTLHESAILFENNLQNHFDISIFVNAPEQLRIDRIEKRDGSPGEQIIERINNQWTDEDKLDLADFVIVNDGETFLIPQVLELDKILKLL